jgi:hypothetical protein
VCVFVSGTWGGGSSRLHQEKQRLIKRFPTHLPRTGPGVSLGRVEMESIFTRLVFLCNSPDPTFREQTVLAF